MKKINLILFFALLSSFSFSQNLKGRWLGELNLGATNIRLLLHVDFSDSSKSIIMDSPDQSAFGFKANAIYFEKDSIYFEVPKLKAKYFGHYNQADSGFSGIFNQVVNKKLNFRKMAKDEKLYDRPQLEAIYEKKTLNYSSKDWVVSNSDSSVVISGTFTKPKLDNSNFPILILISGSGPSDRDETIYGHKPFFVIADYLSSNGIGVFRYDDRGVGKSTGNFAKATTKDFADDTEMILNELKKKFPKHPIGLAGHSEGGMIAQIASVSDSKPDFVIFLAAPAVSGMDILLLQSRLIMEKSGVDQETIALSMETNQKSYEIIKNAKDLDKASEELMHFFEKQAQKYPEEQNAEKTLMLAKMQLIQALYSDWYRYFMKFEPKNYLTKIKVPLHVCIGGKDLQVPMKENLKAMKKYLGKAKNKQVKYSTYPDLNHLFQHADSGLPAEYMKIKETFAPIVLKDMLEFIQEFVVNGN